ncbi:MAG: type II toxin-antitoxin system RelB/DinJ family antitoxin [Bacteroides sp.]|nr:type II toxin-antitoxin system RelB/DinJ family antitoxin [Bacillota bacterium]MCM1393655.1 type II toxin-antitoxin system RelB/DinJ family antitoxin [[Eubacterium] siraeum]MCM1455607.1 type II toxin-antitoxin system RelB/DinJ family antitoxin [Bacteroides sp.]
MKTSVNIKVDTEVRDKAKELFGQMGLDMTTAVNMFLLASIREQGIPFPVTAKSKQEDFDRMIASKLRIAEEQEKAGQMRSFDEFATELKNKYGI